MPTVPARSVEPMLLQQTAKPPEGAEWLYELKLDGYRAIAFNIALMVVLAVSWAALICAEFDSKKTATER
jgi:hypothetical protein